MASPSSSMSTLPNELVHAIVEHAWQSDLSPSVRNKLFATSLLVNKSWLSIFLQIASRDVYIPIPQFKEFYFLIIQNGPRAAHLRPYLPVDPHRRCRSVTVAAANPVAPADPGPARGPPETEAEKFLSRCIKEMGAFLNLKSLCIKFTNVPCNGIFQHDSLVDLPVQVESLSLEYSFTPSNTPHGVDDREEHPTDIPRYMAETPSLGPFRTFPGIRKLKIIGGYDRCSELVYLCPKIECLYRVGTLDWSRNGQVYLNPASDCYTFIRGPFSGRLGDKIREAKENGAKRVYAFTREPVLKGGVLHFTCWLSDDPSIEDCLWPSVDAEFLSV